MLLAEALFSFIFHIPTKICAHFFSLETGSSWNSSTVWRTISIRGRLLTCFTGVLGHQRTFLTTTTNTAATLCVASIPWRQTSQSIRVLLCGRRRVEFPRLQCRPDSLSLETLDSDWYYYYLCSKFFWEMELQYMQLRSASGPGWHFHAGRPLKSDRCQGRLQVYSGPQINRLIDRSSSMMHLLISHKRLTDSIYRTLQRSKHGLHISAETSAWRLGMGQNGR